MTKEIVINLSDKKTFQLLMLKQYRFYSFNKFIVYNSSGKSYSNKFKPKFANNH